MGLKIVVVNSAGKEIIGAVLPPDVRVSINNAVLGSATVDPATGEITFVDSGVAGTEMLTAAGGGFTSLPFLRMVGDSVPAGLAIVDDGKTAASITPNASLAAVGTVAQGLVPAGPAPGQVDVATH